MHVFHNSTDIFWLISYCAVAIWYLGLILYLEGHMQHLAPRNLFLELIQRTFWVQIGKNDGLLLKCQLSCENRT